MQLSHQSPTLLPDLLPSRCTCATFWHTYPVNSANHAPAFFFFSLFFLVFYLSFFILFLLVLFFFCFLSFFFTSFGQSKCRFWPIEGTNFVKSERINNLIFNTLKISDMTDFVQSKVQKSANRLVKIGKSLLSKRKWITKIKHRFSAAGCHHLL